MALLYDPALLDASDSAVADRLRKQAKTRAVKLIREVCPPPPQTPLQLEWRSSLACAEVSVGCGGGR
eukprot:547915-Rhodomonas_salina.1